MEVEIVRSTTIAAHVLGSATHEIPLTIFDRFASDMHVAVLYAFSPPTPTNTAIIQALTVTLAHFPSLAGRLGVNALGRPCIIIGGGGGGVLLVEANVVCSVLADHVPIEPSRDLLLLHPPVDDPAHVLQVQLNRFKCGGVVIGVTANHRVADGQSMSNFFIAWGKAVRGLGVDPLPVYYRPWLRPRDPPRCEYEHWGVEFSPQGCHDHQMDNNNNVIIINNSNNNTFAHKEVENISTIQLRYSSDFISKELKSKMAGKHTTFETLLGHLWRKITVARGIDQEEFSFIRVAVNGRRRLRPPVPPAFFGNLVLSAYPKARVRELLEGGVAVAARLIRDAIRGVGEEYFRSLIDFGAMHEEEELVPVPDVEGWVMGPNLEVDSWLGLRFDEVDFGGGGRLCAFSPTWIPAEGVMVFSPGLSGGKEDGGVGGGDVNVTVSLFEEHAQVLKQISHSVD